MLKRQIPLHLKLVATLRCETAVYSGALSLI